MSVVFTENHGRSASVDNTYINRYKRVFRGITDDPNYGAGYILQQFSAQTGIARGFLFSYNTALPASASNPHPEFDSSAQVLSIDADEIDADGKGWTITVQYGAWNPDRFQENPLNMPPAISVEGQVFRQVIDLDINGNPLVNTAGDPYDPGIEIDQERGVIKIEQNLQVFPGFALAYANYLNLNPIWGLDAKTVKQAVPLINRDYHPACGRYYKLSVNFDYDPAGWQSKPLNQGFRQLVSGVQKQILDAAGLPISSPLPLDAAGKVITPPVNPSNIIINAYDVYKTVDFSSVYSFGPIP